jgi:MoCo/4Fe-4S cofactor protein with predicted Tat translocation signal
MSEREPRPTYWRSLSELEPTAEFEEFIAREFPHAAAPEVTSEGRRRFVQLLGASIALAGVGCRYPQDKLVPQTRKPSDLIPGVPKRFATSMEFAGGAVGLHVASYDGRPIKIEGNPDHPESLGAALGFHQASILDMYDPDRLARVVYFDGKAESVSTWDQFVKQTTDVFRKHRQNQGRGLRVLSESSSSPTLARLKGRFLNANPEAKWVEWEPVSRENEIAGAKLAFGRPVRAQIRLEKADVILTLADDLFVERPDSIRLNKEFSRRRTAGDKGDQKVNRLYAVESRFTTSGTKADHRLPLRAEQIKPFVVALDARLAGRQPSLPEGSFLREGFVAKFLDALVEDLNASKGKAVVAAGRGQPAEVHAIVHRINATLNAPGATVVYTEEPNAGDSHAALKGLVREMAAGDVSTLIVLGGNPVYSAPVDLEFAMAMAKVGTKISLTYYKDETANLCDWRLPRSHYLESWGDARAFDGTVSLVQPLIDQLYKDAKSPLDLALHLLQQPVGHEACLRAVRETHGHPVPAPNAVDDKKEGAWRTLVEAGMIAGSAFKPITPTLATLPEAALQVEPRAHKPNVGIEELEVAFHPCTKIYDGRYSNNGWLQELPEPMTKMTWDNAAVMSKKTAEELGLPTTMPEGYAKMIRLSSRDGKRELELPAYILPGHANGSISLFLGYGRTAAGHIGGSDELKVDVVGFNVNVLRSADRPDAETGFKATRTGADYRFSLTQEHHLIDVAGMQARHKRLGELVHEVTAEEASKPGFKVHVGHAAHVPHAKEKPGSGLQVISPSDLETEQGRQGKNLSPWHEWEYKGRRWGMAIDLSKCTGCSACVVACQAENNVPIVGKEQVWRNREMHWIRIDRYFKGDADHPEQVESVHQPMTCQQCENAPCESVCPVAATTHSSEGLNDMVYNRCVGTRYCSNNCPYKVRRFNFFNYYKNLSKPENEVAKLVYNPEVTVRQRGVMEKCTYCVQRIQNVKIAAKAEWRKMGPRPDADREPLPDGSVIPACAQTCPTEAIIFGDLGQANQPASAVALKHQSNRSYSVLEELNTKPRTRYLAVVRNPNPKLASLTEKAEDGHGSHG